MLRAARSATPKRLRRVLFNVPGEQKKLTKATQLNLDTVVLDLEDGVALNHKKEARKLIVSALFAKNEKNSSQFGRAERAIRMNSIGSGFEVEDLQECIKPVASSGNLDAILLPKVETPEHLQIIGKFLDDCGEQAKNVKLLAAIESARSMVFLKEIIEQAPPERLEALIFASEDFCADMGMTRTPEATELLYARSCLVTHAVAYGLQAIDMVCIDYKNTEILKKETTQGRQMGFTGKQAIHPNQIEPIYEAFRPSEKELDFAKRIIAEHEKHQAEGKGAFSLDGKMIDMPMYLWALNIVQRASA